MQCWSWQDRYSDRYRHRCRAGCQGRGGGYCWNSLQDEGPEDEDGADSCKPEASGVEGQVITIYLMFVYRSSMFSSMMLFWSLLRVEIHRSLHLSSARPFRG